MRRPRTLKVREIIRLLMYEGFEPKIRGGTRHQQWYHTDGRRVTVQRGKSEISGATLEDLWKQLYRR